MNRYRYRRRQRNSLGSVVDDSAHLSARFGPLGALFTGAAGFTMFYAVLPLALMAWTDTNKAKLTGPLADEFGNLLYQIIWHRFIDPCQWAGIAILLVCWAIAVWKLYMHRPLSSDEVSLSSNVAKVISSVLRN